MQTLSKNPPDAQLRIALCGLPGTRKTTIGLHFALFEAMRGKALYVADLDGNMTTALGLFQKTYPNFKFTHDGKEYTYDIRYTDFVKETQAANKKLNKSMDSFTHEKSLELLQKDLDLVAKDDTIGCVFIDSQTVLNQYVMAAVKGTDAPETEMRIQDWNAFMSWMQQLIFAVRSTGKIIIWSAHEQPEYEEVRDKDGKVTGKQLSEFTFNIPGKTKHSFSSYFSDTWSFDYVVDGKTPKWTMLTHQTSMQTHVKNSLNLPPSINLPNEYRDIFPTFYNFLGERYPKS